LLTAEKRASRTVGCTFQAETGSPFDITRTMIHPIKQISTRSSAPTPKNGNLPVRE
jgi:hypothetical protein